MLISFVPEILPLEIDPTDALVQQVVYCYIAYDLNKYHTVIRTIELGKVAHTCNHSY
jgi:hypothetical protein